MIATKIFPTKQDTANALAKELAVLLKNSVGNKFTIALSGGSTPFIMFEALVSNYGNEINWENIHFYWVDERCVDPSNVESNFGNTKNTLFDHIEIPPENIHRVLGENDSNIEVERYSNEIKETVSEDNGKPQFDLILLGMGDDGHTASIFPPEIGFINSHNIAEVAKNPYSGQIRISLTGTIINNAKQIIFLVTGSDKAPKFEQIYKQEGNYLEYPAAHISNKPDQTSWFLDAEAAPFL